MLPIRADFDSCGPFPPCSSDRCGTVTGKVISTNPMPRNQSAATNRIVQCEKECPRTNQVEHEDKRRGTGPPRIQLLQAEGPARIEVGTNARVWEKCRHESNWSRRKASKIGSTLRIDVATTPGSTSRAAMESVQPNSLRDARGQVTLVLAILAAAKAEACPGRRVAA
jgi:hypothetical protein